MMMRGRRSNSGVLAVKRRRISGGYAACAAAQSVPRPLRKRPLRGLSESSETAESAVHALKKMNLAVKSMSERERDCLLDSLNIGSRETMEVKVQTTMCFQRFLNAEMMSPAELSDMQGLTKKLQTLRNLQKDPRVLFINATELGGGVAEMRLDTIALLRDLNFRAKWLVMDGAERFYKVTVHMHEGLQNPSYAPLESHEIETFHLTTIANFLRLEKDQPLSDTDILWIDDPQPLGLAPLVKLLYPKVLVVWRCHIHLDAEPSIRNLIKDLTSGNLHPERDRLLLSFLKSRGCATDKIPPVDMQVFHRDLFASNLGVPTNNAHIMPPCINPLSFKNMPLNDSMLRSTLVKYGIMDGPKDGRYPDVPPYVLEVSRFDPYKGPLELITAFRDATLAMPLKLQQEIRLVLVASLPGDNPSGIRLARILQEYVDSLDLDGLPVEQRAGGPHDLRKRIHLLMLDDKAPWERLLERLYQFRHESDFKPNQLKTIAREVREMASLPIVDAVASLQHCGLVSAELAAKLAADPLPDGVRFTRQQKLATLETLEIRSAQRRVDPGGTAVTRRRAEKDCLTGKELNALEVNALQSGASVRVQFSSKEGFGLTVSESLVKSLPGHEGLTICSLVGGIQQQAEACDCLSIEYPPAEVTESLEGYRALPDEPTTEELHSLSARISKRSSVAMLVDFIRTATALPRDEIEHRSKAARNAVLAHFSTWVNVHNILKGLVKAADFSA